MLLEVGKPCCVFFYIVGIIEPLFDNHIHPGKKKCRIGPRLNRQPIARLRRGNRESGIDHNQRRAVAYGLRKFLHLGVVHILAEMRAEQGDAARVFHVGVFHFGRTGAIRKKETGFHRPPAQGIAGHSYICRAVGGEKLSEPNSPCTMGQEGKGLRTVFTLNRQHFFRCVVQGFVPFDLFKNLPGTLLFPYHGFFQPVRVVHKAGAARPSGAKFAIGERVMWIAGYFDDFVVFDMDQYSAFPEAQSAIAGNDSVGGCSRISYGVGLKPVPSCINTGARDDNHCSTGNLDEIPSCDLWHTYSLTWNDPYFSRGYGQAMMPPSMTLTFFHPLPSKTSAAS